MSTIEKENIKVDEKETTKTVEKTDDSNVKSENIEEQKKIEEKETTENSKGCPFLSSGTKKASPFLTSKTTPEATPESEEEAAKATILKQHNKIDMLIKDNSIFNAVGKLYFIGKEDRKLETRGEGKFAIIKDKSNLYKLLMIRDHLMLKGCNHYIAESCPLIKAVKVPRSWVWTALNDESDAEVKADKITYFATFKTDEDSEEFFKRYNEAAIENTKQAKVLKESGKNE